MTGAPIVAFLSTGRCGTQWLTAGLRELHPDVEAEHEPIGPLYKPRRYFRRYSGEIYILLRPDREYISPESESDHNIGTYCH